jgi:hypothetical protein
MSGIASDVLAVLIAVVAFAAMWLLVWGIERI